MQEARKTFMYRMQPQQCSLVLALLLCCCCQHVTSHALMVYPASRNWLAYLEQNYYWSHGLSAGGARATAGNGTLTWPDISMGSYCGDAVNESRWDTPGPVQATYVQGQAVDLDVVVAVNHLGRFDFKLCSIAAKPGDGSKCHQLQRVDTKGMYWYLPFVKNWSGGNSGHDKPLYGDGSYSWYTMPSIEYAQGCRTQQLCNQFVGMVVYRTKWRLPFGVTCQHCKLQWNYMTAHNCWPPCPEANADEPTCKNVQVYPECGKPGTAYPEHFMGCADVRVLDHFNARPAGLKDTPAWEPQVSLQTGSFGTPAAYQMFGSEPLQHTVRKPVMDQSPANASKPVAPDSSAVDSSAGLAPSPAPYLNPKLRGPPPVNTQTPGASPSPEPQATPTPPGQTTDIMPSPAPNAVTNTPPLSSNNDTLAVARPPSENQTIPSPPAMATPPYPVIHMGFKPPQNLSSTGSVVGLSTEPQLASVPLPGAAASSAPGVWMVLPSQALAVSPSSPVTGIATVDGSKIPLARPPLEPLMAVKPLLEAPSLQATSFPAAGVPRPLQPPAAGSAAAEAPAAPPRSFKLPQRVEAPQDMTFLQIPGPPTTMQQPGSAASLGAATGTIYDTGLSLKLPQRINLPQGLPSPPPPEP